MVAETDLSDEIFFETLLDSKVRSVSRPDRNLASHKGQEGRSGRLLFVWSLELFNHHLRWVYQLLSALDKLPCVIVFSFIEQQTAVSRISMPQRN
jgi:hypothetical protein